MGIKATRTEFDLGTNRHKQPFRLVHAKASDGAFEWTLTREPACQRDDRESVHGLTDEMILAMAEAVRAARGQK